MSVSKKFAETLKVNQREFEKVAKTSKKIISGM
jgi:hypothetical protein